jgi:hypothetical protein
MWKQQTKWDRWNTQLDHQMSAKVRKTRMIVPQITVVSTEKKSSSMVELAFAITCVHL